ncbi:MAG: hypothetical protein ABII00_10205 [Elusimicrobiota bacterium]
MRPRAREAFGRRAVRLLLAGALLWTHAPAAGAGEIAPTDGAGGRWLEYFPDKAGSWRKYAVYYASRGHKRRKLVKATFWDVVMAEEFIHGMRALIVREAEGPLFKRGGKWLYGAPQRAIGEKIYIVTPGGVSLYSQYQAAPGEMLSDRRSRVLESLRRMPKRQFIGSLDNWVLPFPVRRGLKRRRREGTGYYKVLRVRSGRFVPGRHRKSAVGVAGFLGRDWLMTNWYVRGEGVVLTESANRDPGVDRKEFPYKVRVLLPSGKDRLCFARGPLSRGRHACPRVSPEAGGGELSTRRLSDPHLKTAGVTP